MTKSLQELASEINLQLFYILFAYLRTDVKKTLFMLIQFRGLVYYMFVHFQALIQFIYT